MNNSSRVRTTVERIGIAYRVYINPQFPSHSYYFGSAYTKIGTIQRRLAWPLRKDDTQIREAFQIFCSRFLLSRPTLSSTFSSLKGIKYPLGVSLRALGHPWRPPHRNLCTRFEPAASLIPWEKSGLLQSSLGCLTAAREFILHHIRPAGTKMGSLARASLGIRYIACVQASSPHSPHSLSLRVTEA